MSKQKSRCTFLKDIALKSPYKFDIVNKKKTSLKKQKASMTGLSSFSIYKTAITRVLKTSIDV